ncbi:MAG: hypothetical protein CMF74_01185 [Maricaulis sp.]|jgi:DNA-binding NarL/FixJ family response regulator|nr:hypothetical protein [Maricaulis sp.]HAQ36092.1 hypothetical protein [Alphaproteobacteria bacterium]|tara:strand:+ start:168 stop:812 length:645 start_codon:yes stop_codon:yes gene_type:complete
MSTERRIAVVDDHRMFADGFNVLLEQSGENFSVTAYDDPITFLEAFSSGETFDLVIVDLIMRGMNGLALLSAIRARKPGARVLILSGITSAPPVADMKQMGAGGFVHKSASMETLLDAVSTVLSGGSYFDGASSTGIAEEDEDAARALSDMPHLAPRQLDVLNLMGQGETNKMIAETLSISENTVKSHMRAIFDALGVRTRTACVRKAQMLGLI